MDRASASVIGEPDPEGHRLLALEEEYEERPHSREKEQEAFSRLSLEDKSDVYIEYTVFPEAKPDITLKQLYHRYNKHVQTIGKLMDLMTTCTEMVDEQMKMAKTYREMITEREKTMTPKQDEPLPSLFEGEEEK